MSVPLVSAMDKAHAKRWREWQLKNEHGQRKGSRRAQVVFAMLFTAVGIWLGLQLVPWDRVAP